MIWNIYRLIICIIMAFFLNESVGYMFSDDPISSGWANFSFILCSFLLWERLEMSIKIQRMLGQ